MTAVTTVTTVKARRRGELSKKERECECALLFSLREFELLALFVICGLALERASL